MKKTALTLGIVIILLIGFSWFSKSAPDSVLSPSTNTKSPQFTIIATNLNVPWEMVFLPDKSILFTERIGNVRLIDSQGHLQSQIITTIKKTKAVGEGGLLGMTLHPNFSVNNFVYLYYTYDENNNNTLNRVVRMTYQNQQLIDEQVIVDKIPGSSNHNGGRIKFGPDNYLYITTGDAGNPSQAQDINSLGGKILRVTDEGKSAPGNPFNNLIYSYGHRNPQGLDWDINRKLWSTEHGRSGVLSGLDELNLIEIGKNYGWPIIQGDETKTNMETPKFNSGAFTTWAPTGVAFTQNSLFFGGLRGKSLFKATFDGDKITISKYFENQFGRIRDVVLGPDNFLYITTSNRDGRGIPIPSDDRIIKINLSKI